jgi:hypothetical protein
MYLKQAHLRQDFTTQTSGETGKKVTGHMRDKNAKTDIKLKHKSINIIQYRVR